MPETSITSFPKLGLSGFKYLVEMNRVWYMSNMDSEIVFVILGPVYIAMVVID